MKTLGVARREEGSTLGCRFPGGLRIPRVERDGTGTKWGPSWSWTATPGRHLFRARLYAQGHPARQRAPRKRWCRKSASDKVAYVTPSQHRPMHGPHDGKTLRHLPSLMAIRSSVSFPSATWSKNNPAPALHHPGIGNAISPDKARATMRPPVWLAWRGGCPGKLLYPLSGFQRG